MCTIKSPRCVRASIRENVCEDDVDNELAVKLCK